MDRTANEKINKERSGEIKQREGRNNPLHTGSHGALDIDTKPSVWDFGLISMCFYQLSSITACLSLLLAGWPLAQLCRQTQLWEMLLNATSQAGQGQR